jgi:galactokinase
MDSAAELFQGIYKREASICVHAPGSITLLGGNTTGRENLSLSIAIDRKTTLHAAPRDDHILSVYDANSHSNITVELNRLEQQKSIAGSPLPEWALYPSGIAWSMQKAGITVGGADVSYISNIPISAGSGVIEAILIGFSLMWDYFSGRGQEAAELVDLCQNAVQGYVGKPGRINNPSVTLSGLSSHALYSDTQNYIEELIPVAGSVSTIIAASPIQIGNPEDALQERRKAIKRAAQLLRQYKPDLKSLRYIPSTELMAYLPYLPEEIRSYAEHIVKENARVTSACSALKRSDMEALGAILYSSHNSLRDLFRISSPEVDRIISLTRQIPGCYGARLIGDGSGTSVVILVADPNVKEFSCRLAADYQNATGIELTIIPVVVSNGAWIEIL